MTLQKPQQTHWLTLSAHVFMQTLYAIQGRIREHQRIFRIQEDIEDIEYGGHMTLPRLVHLLTRRVLDAHRPQRREQGAPPRAYL